MRIRNRGSLFSARARSAWRPMDDLENKIRDAACHDLIALSPRMAGDRDLIRAFQGMDTVIANLANNVPRLRGKFILADCGQWSQHERALQVNAAMIDFLREL